MRKILFILICLFVSTDVYAYHSSDPQYNGGYVMPDLYNTGPITSKSQLVDFGNKYPEVRTDATRYVIDAKSAKKYNYVFEGFKSKKQIIINGVSNVTIKDFVIEMGDIDYYAIRIADFNNVEQPTNILITDGEITGSKSAVFQGGGYTARRLYIHDYYGDAFKAGDNQVIESCYIGSGGIGKGAHSDGLQVSFQVSNFKVLGNRFDMIAAGGNYKANAALFLSLEKDTATNATFNYNWLNGGGYTMYLFEYEVGKFTNVSFKNNIFGNGKRFRYINTDMKDRVVGLDTSIYAEDENVPFIGSVVFYNQNGDRITDLKDTNDRLKVLVNTANYTPNEQNIILVAKLYNYKNELVKTYEKRNTIMRNMTGREYLKDNGEVIKKVSLNDFPQNVATILEINDLPSNLDGYYVTVDVYKNVISEKTLRTSNITNSNKKEYKLVDLVVETKKTSYKVGDILEKGDFVVKALYSDETSKIIDDYTISELNLLTSGSKFITISYTDNGLMVDKKVNIVVTDKNTQSEKNNDSLKQKNDITLGESSELRKEEKKDEIVDIKDKELTEEDNQKVKEEEQSDKKDLVKDLISDSKDGRVILIILCVVGGSLIICYDKRR